MTTESERDIAAQPAPTCPMIDEVIGSLHDAERHLRGYRRCESVEELRDSIDSLERELFYWGSAEDRLEKIRKHVEAIRQWGQEWKEYALALEEEATA